MRFSVCIPNYNYEKYLGETLKSAIHSAIAPDTQIDPIRLQITLADNASTDRSWEITESIQQEYAGYENLSFSLVKNQCNVGFAANLDRAARLAVHERLILLSSDDLINPHALQVYQTALTTIEKNEPIYQCTPDDIILTATMRQIDGQSQPSGMVEMDRELWLERDLDPLLSKTLGCSVYRVSASEMLGRCLLTCKNPCNFAATCYSKAAYEKIEGYGAGRMINPDKWFHWRLLTQSKWLIYIDHHTNPLFSYRWHQNNQSAQQNAQSALKFLVDEYASTLEVDARMLSYARITKQEYLNAFMERIIGRHGLATLADGNRLKAERILHFGRAVYPEEAKKNKKVQALATFLAMGEAGKRAAQWSYRFRQELAAFDIRKLLGR